MFKRLLMLILLLGCLLVSPTSALAQTYYFQVQQLTVNVFWNADGSESLDYVWVFKNDSSDPIEYVDLGLPNSNFDVNTIYGDVGGKPITFISKSEFEGIGSTGVALGLGDNIIPTGQVGRVHAFVGVVERVLYDSEIKDYASAVFVPAYFKSSVVHGTSDITVIFHLPPGVQPDEPKWHTAPEGFPAEPETYLDDEGRVVYSWRNSSANSYTKYEFGASFPKKYIPDSAIVRKNIATTIGSWIAVVAGAGASCLIPALCIGGVIALIVGGVASGNKRKLQYLPPKISIEGHGIKRGLTAVEAAILMEQPMDKVLTMVLFSTIKKNAAQVEKSDPLEVKALEPLPAELNPYETEFLAAFKETGIGRRRAMQDMMINLVKSVAEKMKGFSRKETTAYYRTIMEKAWAQVEAANTPEVKSQAYEEVMEWTMLDKDYDRRTKDVFSGGPVFVPMWWGHYSPGYGQTVSAPSTLSGGKPSVSLPHLPGADFAASIAKGAQNFAGSVIGNVTDFTSHITNKTNPVPVSTSSGSSRSGGGFSGGGGHSCACACACAGCACACAGGGR